MNHFKNKNSASATSQRFSYLTLGVITKLLLQVFHQGPSSRAFSFIFMDMDKNGHRVPVH